jgi:hypothetical protein
MRLIAYGVSVKTVFSGSASLTTQLPGEFLGNVEVEKVHGPDHKANVFSWVRIVEGLC